LTSRQEAALKALKHFVEGQRDGVEVNDYQNLRISFDDMRLAMREVIFRVAVTG
jgi:hypothetical protein